MSTTPDSILSRTAIVDERIIHPIPDSKKFSVTGTRPYAVPKADIIFL